MFEREKTRASSARYMVNEPPKVMHKLKLFQHRYCIPMDDSRPFTSAEVNFFSKCGTGSGEPKNGMLALSPDVNFSL